MSWIDIAIVVALAGSVLVIGLVPAVVVWLLWSLIRVRSLSNLAGTRRQHGSLSDGPPEFYRGRSREKEGENVYDADDLL